MFFIADSIEKAKQKLKLAEVNSDLQTEEEIDVLKPNKRVIFKKKTCSLYSDSSDDDDDDDHHKRPPPLKKQFLNCKY